MSILVLCLHRRAKTRRGRKFLEERGPKLEENTKSILLVHGTKCPQMVQDVFKDWVMLRMFPLYALSMSSLCAISGLILFDLGANDC